MTDPVTPADPPEIVRRAVSMLDVSLVAAFIGGEIDEMDPHPPREVLLAALMLLHYVLLTNTFPELEQFVPFAQSMSTHAMMLTVPTAGGVQ